jgi:phage tail sheath protein FI
MPTFTYPGVYIEEIESGVHTITGVATSIAAFAGWAPMGPTASATLVQSYSDYETQFGGFDPRSYLGYSVNQFFANGGQQAYIIRLASAANPGPGSTATAAAQTINVTGGSVTFTAASPGAWANDYSVQIGSPGNGLANNFKLSVAFAPRGLALQTVETFDNQTVGGVGALVSNYIKVTTGGAPTVAPVNGNYPLTGGSDGNGINVPGASSAAVAIGGITFNSSAPTATVTIATTTAANTGLVLSAVNAGAWGNTLAVQIQPRADDYTRFSLVVLRTDPSTAASTVVENFTNLSLNPTDPQARYVVNVLNEQSTYLIASMGATAATLTNTPGVPVSSTPSTPASTLLLGGNDGAVLAPTTTASTGPFETQLIAPLGGVNLLDQVPIFNLLIVPGETDPATISKLQGYCHDNQAFLIVDSQQTDTFTTLQNGPTGTISGVNSVNSAFYFPWVNVFDPVQKVTRPFPPSGFVAGLYAATDASRGVWKAPAGIDASLTGEAGLTVSLTDQQNGTLNIQAINCLRNFRVYGDVVWGARTLRGNNQVGSEWKYVPIRRLALYLEQSLYEGTQWVVFEPNDEPLWSQIRLNVGAFMQGLFLQGAFAGTTPDKAYFVKCDAENNPPPSVAQGIVNILVGFAPLFPAEFVVIQITQLAGQTQS